MSLSTFREGPVGSRAPDTCFLPHCLGQEGGREGAGATSGMPRHRTGEVHGLPPSRFPPQTGDNGRVSHLSSAVPLDECYLVSAFLPSSQIDASKVRAPLPSWFISLHPTPTKSLHSSLQSPCCPASEIKGSSLVPGLFRPCQRPLVRSVGSAQVPRFTRSVLALRERSGRTSA